MTKNEKKHFGFVAIIGRPNVGKSTLLNQLLGKKISITARKPQTTRYRILGLKTMDNAQIAYVDTPGLHSKVEYEINRYMNRTARNALKDANVILMVIDCHAWKLQDTFVLRQLKDLQVPVILVINKIDQLKHREDLLPLLAEVRSKYPFRELVPVAAKTKERLEQLEAVIIENLPEEMPLFPVDMITDRDDAFMITEIIREKLTRLLGEEVPYSLTVTLELFKVEARLVRISALIWVEKPGQKIIVIGKGGERLKQIGIKARKELEAHFNKKVFLQLWVKVKSGWTDDQRSLQAFGFER